MIDTEILEDYSSEARELLDEMDHNLMRLEKEGSSPELLNNIFRAVHCIKGSAEYIGLERSSTLTHGVENLLDRLREGAAGLTPAVVEFLFRAKDLIATLISEVSEHHVEKSEISAAMEQLDGLLSGAPTEHMEVAPSITQDFSEDSSTPEASLAKLEAVAGEEASTWNEGASPNGHGDYPGTGEAYKIEEETFDVFSGQYGAQEGTDGFEQVPEGSGVIQETLPDSAEEFAMGQVLAEPAASEGSLEETVPHILSISLYLDDLQDGLNEEEALSSILQKLELLKEHPGFGGYPEMMNILSSIEEHLSAVIQGFGGVSPDDVDRLRSLLHDLRPYYPESLFPLEPRSAALEGTQIPESQEDTAPSSFVQELEQVPGVSSAVAQAILDAGFSSWDDVASASMASLTNIEGISPPFARSILMAAGVTPPEPKPLPVAGPSEPRSLLADVDDELLSEFEGIFGKVGEPASPEEAPAQAIPFNRAADLLEELDGVGAEADREIMEIFLSYGWEILHKLRPIVSKIREEGPDRGDLERAADLIRQIRSSSTYMDYQNLATFLDEWYEKTLWICERLGSASFQELDFMQNSLLRFQDFLAGLEAALNPEEEALASAVSSVPVQAASSTEPSGHAAGSVETGRESQQIAALQAGTIAAPDEVGGEREISPEVQRASGPSGRWREQIASTPELPAVPGSVPDLARNGALVKTMRVDSSKVDVLLNQVGELVVNRSYVEQLSTELKDFQRLLMATELVGKREIGIVKDLTLKVAEASLSLGRVATDIQEGVMKLRMLPVGQLFNRMPRLIRDLSRRVGKIVNLEVYGGDTEVDKRVIEQIYNPLVHLIRNAVDHGIEDGEIRKSLGKSEEGTVVLRAYSEGNQVVIDVEDDGTGINKAAVIRKAVESRFIDAQDAENIPTQEVYNFLFLPGFSTSEQVTRTSGRGVGMDVVKKDVEKINGHVEIESWEEQGTRISIKIPLTLAIIQTLLIKSGKHHFAVPLTSVREIIQVSDYHIETIEGFEVIKFRDETIPVLRIAEVFHLNGEDEAREAKFLVLATAGLKSVGFLVEELVGEQDVVIKPLAEHVCEIRGLAGSTILGDGTIALVMDVTEIVDDIIFQQRQGGGQGTLFGRTSVAELR